MILLGEFIKLRLDEDYRDGFGYVITKKIIAYDGGMRVGRLTVLDTGISYDLNSVVIVYDYYSKSYYIRDPRGYADDFEP